jgi:dihydroorotate dehydrogenase
MAKMAQLTKAFPDKEFSGIGGISTFEHALNYFLLGCGTTQVCTAAMLDHAIGPNVIKALTTGMSDFMDSRGFASLDAFRGARRDRIVPHSQIKRPDTREYHGGYEDEAVEGYARAEGVGV